MIEHPKRYETGVIHGRFQILHNDHLKYLLAGKDLCRHLVIGITNPDPYLTDKEEAAPTRSDPMENPLTYYERFIMVKTVLLDAGIPWSEIAIVPLPISRPDCYRYYVPLDAVFFLSIYDDWGRRKLHYFQSMGLATHVLWEVPLEEKGISAADIRRRITARQQWEHLVPAGVPSLVKQWNIPDRLKQLQGKA
jgi:nicotinamide mononucleotide adenylyltransferase